MNWKAIKEALKELGRLAFFAALAGVVMWLQSKAGSDPTANQFFVYTAIARFLDKYVHENENLPLNGIAPF